MTFITRLPISLLLYQLAGRCCEMLRQRNYYIGSSSDNFDYSEYKAIMTGVCIHTHKHGMYKTPFCPQRTCHHLALKIGGHNDALSTLSNSKEKLLSSFCISF